LYKESHVRTYNWISLSVICLQTGQPSEGPLGWKRRAVCTDTGIRTWPLKGNREKQKKAVLLNSLCLCPVNCVPLRPILRPYNWPGKLKIK